MVSCNYDLRYPNYDSVSHDLVSPNYDSLLRNYERVSRYDLVS